MTFTELDQRIVELEELANQDPHRGLGSAFDQGLGMLHIDVLHAIADGQITDPYEAAHRVVQLELL